MATSLLDRLGLGNTRAVANARQERLRRDDEERLIADLVAALARPGAGTGAETAAA